MTSSRPDSGNDGFTVVELLVAITLAAFLFTALGSVMLASMAAVGIQKSRTQGNEIATVGIEDLQRLKYNALGLCAPPSPPVPTDMADTVLLPNCTGTTVKFGPCESAAQPANSVADEEYTCVRRSINYVVRRFVSYGDIAHTEKRLAVVVDWTDEGGKHRVAQQSSLRIPSQAALIGLDPPTVASGGTGVNPNSTDLRPDGTNDATLTLVAQTTGVVSSDGDTVIAVFDTLGATGRQQQSISLDANGTNSWQKQVDPGTLKLGVGSQYVTFTATRLKDGKVNSRVVAVPLTVNGSVPYPPTVGVGTQPPSTGTLNAQGDLTSGAFSITVTTTNVSPADSVAITFETMTGAVSISMKPDDFTCDTTTCQTTWRATISSASGYHFRAGDLYFYIVARQAPAGGAYPVDAGATSTTKTAKITLT